jgi:hypothetical protein
VYAIRSKTTTAADGQRHAGGTDESSSWYSTSYFLAASWYQLYCTVIHHTGSWNSTSKNGSKGRRKKGTLVGLHMIVGGVVVALFFLLLQKRTTTTTAAAAAAERLPKPTTRFEYQTIMFAARITFFRFGFTRLLLFSFPVTCCWWWWSCIIPDQDQSCLF